MEAQAPRSLRIALAQINVTVGDLEGNTRKILEWIERARAENADIVAFPELAITGYPPEDLLLKGSFIRDNRRQLELVTKASKGIAVVVGFVDQQEDVIFNAAAFAYEGQLRGVYHKVELPNYGVFDEKRYFQRGRQCPLFIYGGVKIGLSVCEDCWYAAGPMLAEAQHGAELLININGSPFHAGKREFRAEMVATRAADANAFVAWVNMVGGQDELVFDGNSMVFGPTGEWLGRGPSFEEDLLIADLDIGSLFGRRLHDTRLRRDDEIPVDLNLDIKAVEVKTTPSQRGSHVEPTLATPLSGTAECYEALVTGTRDYLRKTGHKKAVVALSGGVDSALTAAIAADALGPQGVVGVLLPSRYTSSENIEDAELLAEKLDITTQRISIDEVHQAYEHTLGDTLEGLAAENIQPRIRGAIVMALCNRNEGWLLLTTGNKSELATGYATLYGDMAGGFAVLKDVPKTMVWDLCRYRNSLNGEVIPRRIIDKAPSAELKPDQKDTDSLPPYEILDPILTAYVEEDRSLEEMVGLGFERETVTRVMRLVDRSEYKRRQAPPGVKITPRAFGRDRRMPIVNRYVQKG